MKYMKSLKMTAIDSKFMCVLVTNKSQDMD